MDLGFLTINDLPHAYWDEMKFRVITQVSFQKMQM